MAINISDKYPGRSNPPSVDYPQGSIKNQTAPGAKDGTPLDEAWANDKEGFFQGALAYRGVTPSGTPDTATNSQYFDAVFSDPSESLRGMPLVVTDAEARAMTNNAKMLTAAKLAAAFSGSNQGLSGSSGFQRFPGGLLLQWGSVNIGATGIATVSFPVAFASGVLASFACDVDSNPTSLHYGGASDQTTTTMKVAFARNGAAGIAGAASWMAIGK